MTITLTREEAQQVLDALVFSTPSGAAPAEVYKDAVVLLQNRLEQPEPEPVMLMDAPLLLNGQPLYTAPLQREWQGLTDEERKEVLGSLTIRVTGHLHGTASTADYAKAIEAKLREKNGG